MMFKVLVNGADLLLPVDGKLRKLGFYTTRFIDARDEQEAQQRALDLVWS